MTGKNTLTNSHWTTSILYQRRLTIDLRGCCNYARRYESDDDKETPRTNYGNWTFVKNGGLLPVTSAESYRAREVQKSILRHAFANGARVDIIFRELLSGDGCR